MLGERGVRPALVVNQAVPSASFHSSSFEGRQHAFRPHRRFGPGPAGPDLSRLRSPIGHSRGGRIRRRVHHASTFLRPFARRALPRVVATMDALTPGRVSRPAQVSLLHVHGLGDHSASNHPVSRRRSFRTLPLSPTALPPSHCVGGSRLRHWLAGSPGVTRPNRVRHPADWSFTSCCFPPRLTATQLQSVTGRRAYAWRGLAPLRPCTLAGALARGSSRRIVHARGPSPGGTPEAVARRGRGPLPQPRTVSSPRRW